MAESTCEAENESRPRRLWWRFLLTALAVPAAGFVWFVGMAVIMFAALFRAWYALLWSAGMLFLVLSLTALIFGSRRFAARCGAVIMLCGLLFGATEAWHYFTVTRYRQIRDRIDWYKYTPFSANSRVVKVTADPALRMTGKVPRMSAAYALYPLAAGVVQALYPEKKYDLDTLSAAGSDRIYEMLLDGEADLIFGLPPSKQQMEEAKKRGVVYEITPFAREAFVFFVNRRNPVTGLTSEQIRGIYSGRITRWEETGAGTGKILPFQRNEGSGSQTMLRRIMGDTPLMAPPRETRISGMGGIINDVADYRNYPGALGFSFRFFSSEMFRNEEIKPLTVDGVAPVPENIRSGLYPFITDCCVITAKPRDENLRRIAVFLHSPTGREMTAKTGYTPYAVSDTK